MAIVRVGALDEPRLADYAAIGDAGALVARGLFVAEGRLVVERLVHDRRFALHSLLLTETAAAAMRPTVEAVPAETPIYVAPQAVMNAVVGFNIHRGCLALAVRPAPAALRDLPLASSRAVVVAEGVNNPDNVGGLFRNAAALGAGALVLGPECGDPLYRKAIRTSMAAALRLPWAQASAWPGALDDLRAAGLTVVACTPDPDAPSLFLTALPPRVAVLVGAEGPGLSPGALAGADVRVRIPMHAGMDSLNVATAAAIVLAAHAARITNS